MIHLVLDHSALIPCTDKPEEEKQAIKLLGDTLPGHDVVWHVSSKYLKELYSVFERELSKCPHPLPKLQSSLLRVRERLLSIAGSKAWLCKVKPIAREATGEVRMRMHVQARTALKHVDPISQEELERLNELDPEDREVLAIVVLASIHLHGSGLVYLVATDRQLLQVSNQLARSKGLRVTVVTPKELARQLTTTNRLHEY